MCERRNEKKIKAERMKKALLRRESVKDMVDGMRERRDGEHGNGYGVQPKIYGYPEEVLRQNRDHQN